MPRMAHRRQRSSRVDVAGPRRGSPLAGDLVCYAVLVIVGAFAVGLLYLATGDGRSALIAALVLVALAGVVVHLLGFRAVAGVRLGGWWASLARAPLRLAGFDGVHRTLAQARGATSARVALVVSMLVWAAVLAVLAYLLLR